MGHFPKGGYGAQLERKVQNQSAGSQDNEVSGGYMEGQRPVTADGEQKVSGRQAACNREAVAGKRKVKAETNLF